MSLENKFDQARTLLKKAWAKLQAITRLKQKAVKKKQLLNQIAEDTKKLQEKVPLRRYQKQLR